MHFEPATTYLCLALEYSIINYLLIYMSLIVKF